MKNKENRRTLAKAARVCAYISAAAVILWGIATALLMILDSVSFRDPKILRIPSWPLLVVAVAFDGISDDLDSEADNTRDGPPRHGRKNKSE